MAACYPAIMFAPRCFGLVIILLLVAGACGSVDSGSGSDDKSTVRGPGWICVNDSVVYADGSSSVLDTMCTCKWYNTTDVVVNAVRECAPTNWPNEANARCCLLPASTRNVQQCVCVIEPAAASGCWEGTEEVPDCTSASPT
jgi:hypothetical protein